jgi:hypothetical protein
MKTRKHSTLDGEDFGGCTSPASSFDGHVMFEHDGCEAFSN